ncbi:MAG: TetR/AcrR family transcriptional regulator [Chloroflexota bacterium]
MANVEKVNDGMAQPNWDIGIQSREEQHKIRRMAILRVAAHEFNHHGFDQTSLAKLAAELQVTKPAIYYYVKNKDDILEGILSIAIEQFRALIRKVQASEATGLEKLHDFFVGYSQVVSDEFGTCLILMRINAPKEKFRKPYHDLSSEVFAAMQAVIEEGVADQSIAPCNAKYVTASLIATMNETVYWALVEQKKPPEIAVEHFFEVFKLGLEPR